MTDATTPSSASGGFVGRGAEIAELSRALDRATSEQGGQVWIGGE